MKTLRFEGYSDDTFGEYNVTVDDYDNCASGRPIVWKVTSGDVGLYVWGMYNLKGAPRKTPGCWIIGVQQIDEDVPLPSWTMRFGEGESGYSPSLCIDVPDDAEIECVNRSER